MMKLGTQTLSALYLGGQNIKKAYLGEELIFGRETGPSRIPDGYTEVEYIEANGGYISTECVLNDTMKLIADIETLDYPVTRLETFFGATALSNGFRLALTAADIKGSFGGSSSKTVSLDNSARKRTVGMDCKNRTMFVDGSTVEFPVIAIPTNRYITLLSDATNYTMHGRLYSCRMYTGSEETVIRDFVPCVDPSGAVGVYDLVEGKFCGNVGTGTLTAGPAI